jgi:hypothetical protein
MQQKVLQHMTSTGAYSLIMELNETNQQDIEKHLNNMDKRITFTLNNLLHDQSITLSQWKKMKTIHLEDDLTLLSPLIRFQ